MVNRGRAGAPAGVPVLFFTGSLGGARTLLGRAMLLGGYTIVWHHLVLSGGLGVQFAGFDRESGTGIQWNVWPALRVAVGFTL